MMPHPMRLLAPGEAPIIARQHEVDAARALMAHHAPGTPGASSAPGRSAASEVAAPAMPFIGSIASYTPGQRICIERQLTLDEDLHLADHHFVPARPHKPLSACYPVLPMTFSLEIMAEAAACLAPGLGLTAIEQVNAVRWIALADSDSLALRIEARVEQVDALRHSCRIAVAIHPAGSAQPAISAALVFGRHYQLSLRPSFKPLAGAATLNAADIYARRQLFHGPALRCLDGSVTVGAEGAGGTLLVRAPDRLFRSTRTPQLLTDPALMDGVGQLIGIWAMRQQQRITFPIGVGKLEYYGATPAPGSRVPIRIQTRISGKLLNTEVEIGDGAGHVWLRIHDWKSWQFRWDARLLEFRRRPARQLLSVAAPLPPALAGSALVCRRMDGHSIADFDRALLARHYLHQDEMASFHGKESLPMRQLQWLLGRIAAKDAVRAWCARAGGDAIQEGPDNSVDMLHPAAFALENDGNGQPYVSCWPLPCAPPQISIAHCEQRAVAVAHGSAVGIDIERIVPRDAAFQAGFSSAAERALLPGGPTDESITRLWCAKEVLGKLMGTGVAQSPLHYAAMRREAGSGDAGGLLMRHAGSGRVANVASLRDGDFIYALAADAGR